MNSGPFNWRVFQRNRTISEVHSRSVRRCPTLLTTGDICWNGEVLAAREEYAAYCIVGLWDKLVGLKPDNVGSRRRDAAGR